MSKRRISQEQMEEIRRARKANRNKRVEKWLQVLEMRGEGKTRQEIQAATGFSGVHISSIVKKYSDEGISVITGSHYKGNHRNLSFEEERQLLEPFRVKAEVGQIIEVSEIREAYIRKVGHDIGGSQIYYVLKRHGWRKVMPRSQHPNKATEEAIEASKKLNPRSQFWQPK